MIYDITLWHPDEITNLVPKSSGWLSYRQYLIQMTQLLVVSLPDDLTIGSISSGWLMGIAGCHRDDLRYYPISSGWLNIIWTLSHPDEITMLIPKSSGWLSYLQYLIRMTYGYCRMSPGWLTICPISSGWHNVIWTLSHPDELAPGRISSGWLLDTAVCHPDDISYHHMSSGWLSRNQYHIRMSYDTVIMSSGWHTLPFLSHPDEIAIFDFPQHAVALQRFRTLGVAMKAAKHLVTSIIWHVCGEFVNNVFINW